MASSDLTETFDSSPTVVASEPALSVVSAVSTASCQEVKKRQSQAQTMVTKLMTKISKLMVNVHNFPKVKEALLNYDKGMNSFQDVYQEHLSFMTQEAKRELVVEKFTQKMEEFNKFHEKVTDWIKENEHSGFYARRMLL